MPKCEKFQCFGDRWFEFRLSLFGFRRRGFLRRPQSSAAGIEGIELFEHVLERAPLRGFFAMKEAAFALDSEIGLDGLMIAVGQPDKRRRKAVAEDFEIVQLAFEGLGLAGRTPLA